ncbi:MAG: hypothetical protein K8W52_26285 [Deltaproteobacteria bacterium]|nr:hypothetical protein [Deltaproteobacteria bacterium]
MDPDPAHRLRRAGLSRAFDRVIACAPSPEAAEALQGTQRQLGAITGGRQANCGELLGEMLVQDATCNLGVSAEERTAIAAIAAKRTTIPPSGDAALDAGSARIMGMRDRMCACRDAACVTATEQAFNEDVAHAPNFRHAPAAVRDAANEVLDELARCGRHAAYAPAPAP